MSSRVRPASRHRGQARLDGEVEVAAAEGPADGRLADPGDDRPALEWLSAAAHDAPPDGRRSEQREVDVLVLFEDDLDGHAVADLLGFHVDQVGGETDAVLFVDGHQADEVGIAARDPLLHVAGVGHQGGPPADRLGREVPGQAVAGRRARADARTGRSPGSGGTGAARRTRWSRRSALSWSIRGSRRMAGPRASITADYGRGVGPRPPAHRRSSTSGLTMLSGRAPASRRHRSSAMVVVWLDSVS